MRRTLVLALSLALAACGGGGDDEAAPSTTRPAPTTTVEAADPNASPLTGLLLDPALRSRALLVVKVDNAPKARPQSGLVQADLLVEEKVEDGVTRFMAVYQSRDAASVGPVRSARTTDLEIMRPMNRPLFAYAGTNATFQKLVNSAPIVDVGFDRAPGDYRRERGRPAPYNLYTSTPALFRRAPEGAAPPGPLFTFRREGQPFAGQGIADAAGVTVVFKGDRVTTTAGFDWDAGAGVYRRTTDGRPHDDVAGGVVSSKNVIVQFVDYVDTGQRDQSNTIVPEAKLVGSGEAWVLSDGKVVKGRWSKASPEAVTAYTDGSGAPIRLTPGVVFVTLAPVGSATLR